MTHTLARDDLGGSYAHQSKMGLDGPLKEEGTLEMGNIKMCQMKG